MLSSVLWLCTLMPSARTWLSMNGSSSSITSTWRTVFANFFTSSAGKGFVQPSLRMVNSGNTSFTYWYVTPLVMMPTCFLPGSMRLNFECAAARAISCSRFCAARRWPRANAGTGIVCVMSFW